MPLAGTVKHAGRRNCANVRNRVDLRRAPATRSSDFDGSALSSRARLTGGGQIGRYCHGKGEDRVWIVSRPGAAAWAARRSTDVGAPERKDRTLTAGDSFDESMAMRVSVQTGRRADYWRQKFSSGTIPEGSAQYSGLMRFRKYIGTSPLPLATLEFAATDLASWK